MAAARSGVVRDRLLHRLEESLPTELVLITAPAGSGKSTLARQWAERDPRHAAHAQLGAHLDDPAALARTLIGALEPLGAPAPETLAAASGIEPAFSATLLPALTRLAGTRNVPYLLVIDDLHLVRSGACHRLLAALCDGVPSGSQVALLTREASPDWLARLRAQGRLVEIDRSDLALDVGEGAELFSGLGVQVDGDVIAQVVQKTEGWAVGVYLAALKQAAHRGESDAARLAAAPGGSDRYIVDYIRSEVLRDLDDDTRAFLTHTSVLDELSGPVCDAILERTDSAATLARLHDQSQLVIPLDREGRRYRYHHLLAEALQAELRINDPAAIASLHGRAACWFADQGDPDAAIRHATSSGDMALVGECVWPHVVACIGSGHPDRLRAWLGALSDRQIAADPWLSLAAGWLAMQMGDQDGTARWIVTAHRHAGREWRSHVTTEEYAASVAVLDAVVGGGGLSDMISLCEDALSGLPSDSPFLTAAAFLRGVGLTLQRDTERGLASLQDAERLARVLGVPQVQADSLSWQGVLALERGERELSIRLISEASVLIQRNHLDRLATSAHTFAAQALVLAVGGDPAAGRASLGIARRMSGMLDDVFPWFAVCGRLIVARAAVLLGDGGMARQLIAEAKARMTADLSDTLAVDLLNQAEAALRSSTGGGVASPPLTAAELRVLQFLPSNLTFPMVGEHLFLSTNTVKTHARSIYRKLGVDSRAGAVERARTIGLVEAPLHER